MTNNTGHDHLCYSLGRQTCQSISAPDGIDQTSLEDRKYGYFWTFPHHSCENIQNLEFLNAFGYSPNISEQLSDVLGGRSPPLNFRYGLRNNGGVSKNIQKFKIFLDILTAMMGEYPKISIFSVF